MATQRLAAGAAAALLSALAAGAAAGPADVVDARADCDAERVCRFVVSVRHADQGWKHYADAWEVLGPDDALIARRVLRHPHVQEQPFTRALDGVRVPADLDVVRVRARDKVHGYGGAEVEVQIPRPD